MIGLPAASASALTCCASFAAICPIGNRSCGVWMFSTAPRYAPSVSVSSEVASFSIEASEPKLRFG